MQILKARCNCRLWKAIWFKCICLKIFKNYFRFETLYLHQTITNCVLGQNCSIEMQTFVIIYGYISPVFLLSYSIVELFKLKIWYYMPLTKEERKSYLNHISNVWPLSTNSYTTLLPINIINPKIMILRQFSAWKTRSWLFNLSQLPQEKILSLTFSCSFTTLTQIKIYDLLILLKILFFIIKYIFLICFHYFFIVYIFTIFNLTCKTTWKKSCKFANIKIRNVVYWAETEINSRFVS